MRRYLSIATYREDMEMTQATLAKRLGITQSALSMIEQGQRTPRGKLALRIHQLTGVPLRTLLRRAKPAEAQA